MATERSTHRVTGGSLLLAIAFAFATACGGGSDGSGSDASPCPAGTTRRTSAGQTGGADATTREDAVRAQLDVLALEASDEAISAGVIASAPGAAAGTERLVVEAAGGVEVTMILAPQDPGWAVERAEWCAGP
jgi:hypothetical protein